MLLEKYLQAAEAIVAKSVPTTAYVMDEQSILGSRFTAKVIEDMPATMPAASMPATSPPTNARRQQNNANNNNRLRQKTPYLALSYYKPATATYTVTAKKDGKYHLVVDLTAKGNFASSGFDFNKASLALKLDGQELFHNEYAWAERREYHEEFDVNWTAGRHTFQFDLTPLTPGVKQTTQLEMHVDDVIVRGPVDRSQWVRPANYARYFPEQNTPEDAAGRKAAAKKLLRDFATRAFRRPADEPSVSRLADLAETVWSAPGKTYEQGIGKAITAILSSPRFLYREEQTLASGANQAPLVDEYSLASRLSYFLWSSMPDDQLLKLASKNELRKNLHAQVKRMLADPKATAFTENFTGQWLEARDVATVPIDVNRVADSEQLRRTKLQNDNEKRLTRTALQSEVREYFKYVVENDRDVIEFIDSDYTFLNERLATYYGVPDVTGEELRKVQLPPDSPRGGILTMGATLMVTSNPTRTSPVKRGQFILDNVLGIPSPPPPPDIPALEESRGKIKDHTPTLREQLALHREAPVCASCHNRMDPIGLSLEHFNALGLWRDKERGADIDTSGVLITGEKFKTIQDLKKILAANDRKDDFYRCFTEKLLTYALGRGMDYQDVGTIDQIVSKLDSQHGHFSALLAGVIDSPAFQRKQAGDGDGSSVTLVK
jgi:PAS domain-containing protein